VGSAGGASGLTASGASEEGSAIGGVACCAPFPGLSVLDTLGSVPRRIRDTGVVTVAPSGPSGPAASDLRAHVVPLAFCPAPPLLLPEVGGRDVADLGGWGAMLPGSLDDAPFGVGYLLAGWALSS
jgi:hypothetical protein